MASSKLQRHSFPETESEWKQFSKKMAGRFTIDRLNTYWPDRGATIDRFINTLHVGRIEDWCTAESRCHDYMIAEYHHPSAEYFYWQLMHGTCQLDIDIRQSAHKQLFGYFTDTPSQLAIRAIGFGLFYPQGEFFDVWQKRITWEWIVSDANDQHRRSLLVKTALDDLLTELDT